MCHFEAFPFILYLILVMRKPRGKKKEMRGRVEITWSIPPISLFFLLSNHPSNFKNSLRRSPFFPLLAAGQHFERIKKEPRERIQKAIQRTLVVVYVTSVRIPLAAHQWPPLYFEWPWTRRLSAASSSLLHRHELSLLLFSIRPSPRAEEDDRERKRERGLDQKFEEAPSFSVTQLGRGVIWFNF